MSLNNHELNNEEVSVSNSLIEKKGEVPDISSDSRSATTTDIPNFGWSNYAERMNGRFAMMGFIAILIIEILSNKGFLYWAGLFQ